MRPFFCDLFSVCNEEKKVIETSVNNFAVKKIKRKRLEAWQRNVQSSL